VTATANAKVSQRGQTNLPAELRRRWGIDHGGEIGFIDLGDAALVVPGGVDAAAIQDPDLADQ
jgi:bifunctional DNA-binding transcriptional regulator/antitoxin component of YhaV-PrlF toxin-antitoxin module